MIQKLIFCSLFLVGMTQQTFAQNHQIEEVAPKGFDGVQSIPGKGFYTYYFKENLKKGMKAYELKLYDYSYNELGSSQIELSKYGFNGGAATNEDALAIAFVDPKFKYIKVSGFDFEGNELGSTTFSDSKYLTEEMHSIAPLVEIYSADDGFIVMTVSRKSAMKMHFRITKVNNSMKQVWTKEFLQDKENSIVNNIVTLDGDCYISYLKGKGLRYDNYVEYLLKLDTDGNVAFDKLIKTPFEFNIAKIYTDEGILFAFGTYFMDGEPLGIYGMTLDAESGEEIQRVSLDWEKDIYPKISRMKLMDEINPKKQPVFLFSDIVKSDEGDYRVITETMYKKIVPGVGVSATFSTGGSSSGIGVQANTSMRFSDFFIFTFNKDLKHLTTQAVTKPSNKIVIAGILTNPTRLQKFFDGKNITNFQFTKSFNGKNYLVYIIRQKYSSKVRIAVADLADESEVKKSLVVESDMGEDDEIKLFDVLESNENKVMLYTYKSRTIRMYDFTFDD